MISDTFLAPTFLTAIEIDRVIDSFSFGITEFQLLSQLAKAIVKIRDFLKMCHNTNYKKLSEPGSEFD